MSESFPTFLEVSSFSLFPCVPPGAVSELCFSETERNTHAASEVVSELQCVGQRKIFIVLSVQGRLQRRSRILCAEQAEAEAEVGVQVQVAAQ